MDKTRFVTPKKACEILGVHYKTLYNWEESNKIETVRMPGGKRLYNVQKYIEDNINIKKIKKKRLNICYCRVSTYGQKDDLLRQIEYMKEKYPNYIIIKDIGSGLNFRRRGLKRIIDFAIKGEVEEVVITYKDRLCRFGFELITHIIETYSNGKITILNKENLSPNEEITKDLLSILNVFSARVNGLRKYKNQIRKEEISKNIK